ncbi:UdgX family uracil-DNA binding protein [Sphingomonas nostoxanthinifaciens]|uniref:UdgX family uracil-DNA binding protein n=1 Tax=Sphingomonas nostoxanthinifaciens TaxID=2872652 RepID=UPI001CC1C28D|nr:UdgX family uracil-DNA binding protein [Sphingomonas nostoxanthinifaciens]UAK23943.1 UdgX family uracil-DNA binding protein [Sphingomonas nostoxanthinifaciens]
MQRVILSSPDGFDGWRIAARALAIEGVRADSIVWTIGEGPADLFAGDASPHSPLPAATDGQTFSVPRPFVELARDVIAHGDPERFALLYAMLLRLRATPQLAQDHADPGLRRLERMAKEVRRDIHKMRAFLRFREVADDGGVRFVAWFEPEHHIVRSNAAFFVNRFAAMRWSILTPELSIHWDGATLTEGPGATRADAPAGDPLEETWKTYYASIFNPARLKIGMMLKEMPRKYWKNMPETALVPALIAGAQGREAAMVTASRDDMSGNVAVAWEALREEAMGCTRCPLYKPATQTVFGEGPVDAAMMFIGEQPGDQEDLAGRPFIGPAGQLFDRALAQAGVDRARTYVTNAVKHFKYEQRGKRRIHSKPNGAEIEACRWWVEQERDMIRPAVTVALGATAARSMLGRVVTISAARGVAHRLEDGGEGWVTVHPSYLLRIQDRDAADAEFERFVADLKHVQERVGALAGTR